MAYGIIKVDTIIFDQGGADQNATVSGIYRAITSGVTVSGTIAGAVLIGTTTVSGTTVTGTTANFASGVFTTQVSGATVTGTQSSFTSGNFVTLSGATATFTSGVIASGTAAAPSLSIISDPNTGIYSPGAGQVAISTSGVGRLFVDASGNVGVGGSTTNIAGAKRVDIGVAGVSNGLLTLRSSGGAQEANISCSATGLGFTTNSYATPFDARASEIIFGTGSSGTERLRITSAGLVGIGTSSPGEKLTVAGNISLSAAQPYISLIDSIWGAGTTFRTGVNTLGTATGDYQLFNVPTGKGFAFAQNNATNSLVIDTSGRVGIGTSAPAFALDISASTDCVVRARVNSFTSAGFVGSTNNGTNDWFFGSRKDTIGGNSGTDRFNLLYDANAFLTVTTAGNVGIGTTLPSRALEINASNGINTTIVPALRLKTGSTNGAAGYGTGIEFTIQDSANVEFVSAKIESVYTDITNQFGDLRFSTNNATVLSERVRIDSSGRLLVGTSSARSNFFNTSSIAPSFQVEGTTYGTSSLSLIANGTTASVNPYPLVILARTRGTSVGSTTIVSSGDLLGGVSYQGADGTEFVEAASIIAEVDGTPGANDMPGRLVFSTTADGAATPTERMRIDSSGRLLVGTSTTGLQNTRSMLWQGSGEAALYINHSTSDGNGDPFIKFGYNGGEIGSITQSGTTAVAYNTSSDYRLKENVTPVTDGIIRLQQLNPSRFNFIADPAKTVDGFIAHEVQVVVPEAITGEKDAEDDDGNPIYQGIDQSKLVPLLTAALQEAIGEIESLKSRLTAAGI